jgi:glucose-1-phosphate cytidylyltransferase
MKAVILAGGYGTRISEETQLKPKPMVEIGGKPILWHIMKHYSVHNINDFVICLGYKGYMIKEYFANYFLHMSDVTIDVKNNKMEVHRKFSEPWKITLVDTGEKTMTGGRAKRISKYIDGTFCLTYGDGLSNLDITASIKQHKKNKMIGTLTTINPTSRFGKIITKNQKIIKFEEKPSLKSDLINGGFFVFEPEIFNYIKDDNTILEREPLEMLTKKGKLGAYKHDGFWHPMDTLREKNNLEDMWAKRKAPWKTW